MDKTRPSLDLDKPSELGFVNFFAALPPKADATLRLFERGLNGDYFSAHGDDALFVANDVYKTSQVVRYLGAGEGLPSVTLSKVNTESFLRDLLLHRQFRVEIYALSDSKKANSWKCSRRASPGNLQAVEDMLFAHIDLNIAPVVLALKVSAKDDQKIVGAAFADATTMRSLGVVEFVDNDVFSNLETLIIQLSVKECLVPDEQSNYDLNKVKVLLQRLDIVVTERKKSSFAIQDIEQDLNRLVGAGNEDIPSVATTPQFDLKNALASLSALIGYLGLLHDEANMGLYTLGTHDLGHFMRLDSSAMKALNLMPGPHDGNKTMSLYGLLNHCKTAQGSRLLAQWMRQPLVTLADIETRHDLVDALISDSSLRQNLQSDSLKNFPDLNRLAKRFHRGTATLQDVVRVYQCVIKLPELKKQIDEFEGTERQAALLKDCYTDKLELFITELEKLRELVESTIDLDALENHEFLVKADFDEELAEIKSKMDEVQKEIEPEARRVAHDLDMELHKRLKLEHSYIYGHYLRLSRNDSSVLRGNRNYTEIACQKSGVFFQTSTLRDLSDQYRACMEKYQTLQANLSKEIIKITAGYFVVMEILNSMVAELDVLSSFAHISMYAPTPYVRPTMRAKGHSSLRLQRARHPCLECQDEVSFIANDVEMSRDESEFHIITGPNMGGKSTYIRSIGVIALMAQIGCFVPCENAEMPIFDSILARVGAGDSQLKGVSTFMAEMLETANILKCATPNSLIIIDELGRGTSTYDGFGLAWAISEYIVTNIKAFCLFATHFHELTSLSEEVAAVKNLHVTAHTDNGQITLLYQVLPGVCDQSFGIHVAELAHFPEDVVKLAKRKAEELENFESGEHAPKKVWRSSVEEIRDGAKLVDGFFKDLSNTKNLDLMDSSVVASVVSALLDKHKAGLEVNEFVREVLQEL